VRSGMRAVSQLSEEIALRSGDDLAPVSVDALPESLICLSVIRMICWRA